MIDRVVLLNDFSQVRGGAAALVNLLAELLAESAIPVTVISGDQQDASLPIHPMIERVSLGARSLLDRGAVTAALEGIFNRSAARLLSDWIRANDTPRTVYHLHNWAHILSPSIFGTLAAVRGRLVMHAHDYFLVCPNGAFTDYRTGLDCPLVPMSAACISTNCDKRSFAQKTWRVARQSMRQYLWDVRQNATPVLAIHSGMIEKLQRAGVPDASVRDVRNPSVPYTSERIGAERNRELFFIGRVDEEKGAQDFLAAARLADLPARIIGDGAIKNQLAADYPEAVFEGWRSREEIARMVTAARMLVVPSRYPEPYGLVISEALASGLPVIVNGTALLKAEIVHHGIGLSCNTRSIETLAALMRAMADDDDLIATMSLRAFQLRDTLAVAPRAWRDQICGIYESVIATAELPASVRSTEFA